MTAPTHDGAAEEAVIASCLVDADAIERCHATGLTADDFYSLRSQYAYGAIRAVTAAHGPQAVNRITVGYHLGQQPANDGTQRYQIDLVTLAWLSRIEEELPTSIGAEWYAGIVRECAQRRRTLAATETVARLAASGDPQAAEKAAALYGSLAGGPGAVVAPVAAPAPNTTSIVSGALDLL